jgi:predicted nucleic acid-binding protein
MKIYLDTCCYNRPYDDQAQGRIRAEAEAVQNIIVLAQFYGYAIYGSPALDAEIGEIEDDEKREYVLNLYRQSVTDRARYNKAVFGRVKPLAMAAGVKGIDVHHLAFAVAAGVDYLVTADKQFIKSAAGLLLPVKVINPLNFPIGGTI